MSLLRFGLILTPAGPSVRTEEGMPSRGIACVVPAAPGTRWACPPIMPLLSPLVAIWRLPPTTSIAFSSSVMALRTSSTLFACSFTCALTEQILPNNRTQTVKKLFFIIMLFSLLSLVLAKQFHRFCNLHRKNTFCISSAKIQILLERQSHSCLFFSTNNLRSEKFFFRGFDYKFQTLA